MKLGQVLGEWFQQVAEAPVLRSGVRPMVQAHWRSATCSCIEQGKLHPLSAKQGRRLLPNAVGARKRWLCSEFGNGTTNMWHYWLSTFISFVAIPQLPGTGGQSSGRIWPSQKLDPRPLSDCRDGPCEANHPSSRVSNSRCAAAHAWVWPALGTSQSCT